MAESVIIKVQLSQRPIIKKCHVKSCSSIVSHTPTSSQQREISKRINLIAMGVLLVISILQPRLNKQTLACSRAHPNTHTHTQPVSRCKPQRKMNSPGTNDSVRWCTNKYKCLCDSIVDGLNYHLPQLFSSQKFTVEYASCASAFHGAAILLAVTQINKVK